MFCAYAVSGITHKLLCQWYGIRLYQQTHLPLRFTTPKQGMYYRFVTRVGWLQTLTMPILAAILLIYGESPPDFPLSIFVSIVGGFLGTFMLVLFAAWDEDIVAFLGKPSKQVEKS
jgi:hypothetical protein